MYHIYIKDAPNPIHFSVTIYSPQVDLKFPLQVSPATLFLFTMFALLLMALLTFLPESNSSHSKIQKLPSSSSSKRKKKQHPSSWDQIRNLFTCKQMEASLVYDPSSKKINDNPTGYSKLGSCSSICTFSDVVHGNTSRVVYRADNSPESSDVGLLRRKNVNGKSNLTNGGGSYRSCRGMQFRKLSGCYECHMTHTIVDPRRYA